MSSSTFYTPTPAMLVRRRIATYFVGGIDQIPGLVSALTQHGRLVHELSVDVREGVREASMVCTVLVAPDALDGLLGCLRDLPSVVSAELA
ncbi:hypothetical protein [Amycolatopsis jejuensis]|uniref:hypothetical protein n=1 Tax=Amycolatopsis jejuensis TaxID=330084 RepID=UPI000525AA45|nr:hypothetical protein [Amycolatopsis jejuensis]